MKLEDPKNLIVLFNQIRSSLICAFENGTNETFLAYCKKCDEIELAINELGFKVQYNCMTNKYEIVELTTIETINDYEIFKNKRKGSATDTNTINTAKYGRFECIIKVA